LRTLHRKKPPSLKSKVFGSRLFKEFHSSVDGGQEGEGHLLKLLAQTLKLWRPKVQSVKNQSL